MELYRKIFLFKIASFTEFHNCESGFFGVEVDIPKHTHSFLKDLLRHLSARAKVFNYHTVIHRYWYQNFVGNFLYRRDKKD